MKKCIVLADNDNVATVLESVVCGEEICIMNQEFAKKGTVLASEDIPYMHKICLQTIEMEGEIIKFDACIGISIMKIGVGQLVHIHNVQSLVGVQK